MSNLIGKYVIVRCRDAGVHSGILVSYEGRQAILADSRRLWYWIPVREKWLDAVAMHGLKAGSKLGPENPNEKILTEDCEIIGCSPEGEESIRGFVNDE